jgi:hypothetical protein
VSDRTVRLLFAIVLLITMLCAAAPSARAGGSGGYSMDGISLLVQTGDPQIDEAQQYALAVLGHDFDGVTHVAAVDYYTNPWIRDSYAWGMIPSRRDNSVGSYATDELAYWLGRQQPFGGWLTAPKSGYYDETAILIAAVLDAYRVTGNLRMVRRALPKLNRGWRWLAHGYIRPEMGSTVLIYTNVPPHVAADWADQIGRHGYSTQLEALWYWATRCLGIMESLTDHPGEARYYLDFASRIRSDINRILWTVSAPYAHNAPTVAPFGHYRSWLGPRDYFELDSNALCIIYGIADRGQAASIDQFMVAHGAYLLGLDGSQGVPARVAYGDYDPLDYAGKHSRLGPGRYQSASWPTVGALVAVALARTGDLPEARAIIERLSAVFVAGGDIREWYGEDGSGNGAPAFGWAARMFVIALYAAYLGVSGYDSAPGQRQPAGIQFRAPLGSGSAELVYHGRRLAVSVAGSGQRVRVLVGHKQQGRPVVPGDLLCAGCAISAVWSG